MCIEFEVVIRFQAERLIYTYITIFRLYSCRMYIIGGGPKFTICLYSFIITKFVYSFVSNSGRTILYGIAADFCTIDGLF